MPRRPTGFLTAVPTRVPWWGVASSVAAPLLLVGGWTVARLLQPAEFDPIMQSISALATLDAHHRWVMTVALISVGAAHVTTAVALRPARPAGRAVLAVGGMATVLVALNPLPGDGRGDLAHTVAAAVSFVALAAWPAASSPRGAAASWALRPGVCVAAALMLFALLGWYVQQMIGDGQRTGLAERVAAAAQASWPLVVGLSARHARAIDRQTTVVRCPVRHL